LRLELVDPSFEADDLVTGDIDLGHALGNLVRRVGEPCAQREEVALNLFHHAGDLRLPGIERRAGETEPRIQLVDLAVRGDARVRLRHPGPVEQCGLASVACPGVNFHVLIIKARKKAPALPLPAGRQWFRRRLLEWYRRNGRDLPWRNTTDPYHILVSEIMLQQTQVDRVLPKYHEWLGKYPTMQALADAAEADVTTTWRPLGYNVRPRRLHAIARESVTHYGGQLPSDEETLMSFKGIGEYTAGAVLSFAFGQRKAILDTNVARVLFRIFVADGDPKSHAMKRHLWAVSRTVLPMRHVFDFNQALMDFGATLCTARKPKCSECPMQNRCASYPIR
jgi:A/G-specific adenine glycosylase